MKIPIGSRIKPSRVTKSVVNPRKLFEKLFSGESDDLHQLMMGRKRCILAISLMTVP